MYKKANGHGKFDWWWSLFLLGIPTIISICKYSRIVMDDNQYIGCSLGVKLAEAGTQPSNT